MAVTHEPLQENASGLATMRGYQCIEFALKRQRASNRKITPREEADCNRSRRRCGLARLRFRVRSISDNSSDTIDK
jgi:hypothetical protein